MQSAEQIGQPMSIEKNFDISFVAGQALREKQIQQNYRPILAVPKWFAPRPGTLLCALIHLTFGPLYGDKEVPVKYFIWLKEIDCEGCGEAVPLFPGFLLSQDARHPLN